MSTPTSSLTPLTFTGLSPYASDFQSILTRAVDIAQLPITQHTNELSDISAREQLASGIQTALASLATTLSSLNSLGTNQSLTGTSSNTSLVQVDNSSLANPASFTISNITSLASTASVSTTNGYANATTAAVSTTGTMQLKINGTAVTPNIDLTGSGKNNLTGLASAINALNAGVTATVINTATGATPYYLSISANTGGSNNIQLFDDPSGANTAVALSGSSGSNADFYLQNQHIVSPTNTITSAIPGMTFTIAGTTSTNQTVTLSAASDSIQISNQLQTFVSQYNALQTLLNAQIGPSAGLLLGNSMISGVQQALHGLMNFHGGGTSGVQTLEDLGIQMADNTGVMSFNPATFNALTPSQIQTAYSFLGSATGFGLLPSTLTSYSDPVTGSIAGQETQWQTTTTNLNNQINTLIDNANLMQSTLDAKLQAADALIVQMQTQQQQLTAEVQSLNFASFGYSGTNTNTFAPSSGTSSSGG
ncbi:MAG TPA: flagellar filament capping protein FliD [Bryobacteraceae bacterium]|nr:flagellar filament capping protein FliD [Bryobacteraceae bacterium]